MKKEISIDGTIRYYDDKRLYHRNDGPAIERKNGTKYWYVNGKQHRLDGPAEELSDGTKHWYLNDRRHRLNGPAIEWHDMVKEWYYEGEFIDCNSQEEFERMIKLLTFS